MEYLWKISDLTEDQIRNYELNKYIESPQFSIVAGDEVTKW
jgi:hypothetical protein